MRRQLLRKSCDFDILQYLPVDVRSLELLSNNEPSSEDGETESHYYGRGVIDVLSCQGQLWRETNEYTEYKDKDG